MAKLIAVRANPITCQHFSVSKSNISIFWGGYLNFSIRLARTWRSVGLNLLSGSEMLFHGLFLPCGPILTDNYANELGNIAFCTGFVLILFRFSTP